MDERLQVTLLRSRVPVILGLNLILTAIAYFAALGLRFDFVLEEMLRPSYIALPLSVLLLVRLSCYVVFGLNRGYWRYASTHDLTNILKAHAISSLLFTAIVMFLRVPGFPRSVIFIEFALSVLLAGGSRLLVRLWCEKNLSRRTLLSNSDSREILVLGGGDSGHLLVKTLLSNPRLAYNPIGVLDDSERLIDAQVHGIKVFGPISKLERYLEHMPKVSAVIIAIPSLSSSKTEEIEKICKHFGIACKRLQAFEDIACLDANEPQTALSIESVLEKQTAIEHEDEIRNALKDKRVLVTGAGGSIGSELVRQILHFNPAHVTLLDSGEFNLFNIERELSSSSDEISMRYVVGNICDEKRLLQVMREDKPQFVFHAAAYKHVPLMEHNCYEAFKNNVLGTRNLLNVSHLHGVERFVMISTDKAVDPSSVMGASKRIAEMLVQRYRDMAKERFENHSMATAVVRFGNVINSAGSVIPLFKQQILSGGPITVTHPDIERYFMSIREAVRLVLTAGTLGSEGEVYILEMGRPIRIVDVAKKMRALYGRRDIPIVFTGLRPGEKLTEKLTCASETVSGTRFNKVNRVKAGWHDTVDVFRWVAECEDIVATSSNAEISSLMKQFSNQSSNEQAPQTPATANQLLN